PLAPAPRAWSCTDMPAHRPAAPGRRPATPGRRPARPARGSAPTPAREVALAVLRAVTDRDAYANLLLPALLAERGLHGREAALAPDRAVNPAGYLAVKTSHPGWVVAAFSESLGEEPVTGLPLTEAALAADNTRPLVTLCAVPGLADPAGLTARGGRAARWSP